MPFTIQSFREEWTEQRARLLQASLRDPYADYSIADEYPIVLDPEHGEFSICVLDHARLIAHANMWPRTFTDAHSQDTFPVALLGNVATDPAYRNQGVMRSLFAIIVEKAHSQKLDALVLWSDLDQFYQKLGFTAFGTEFRWIFARMAFSQAQNSARFAVEDKRLWDRKRCEVLLNLRQTTRLSLRRSGEEFAVLLRIPDLILLTGFVEGSLQAYCLLGKGADLVGVIHEWGAAEPLLLLEMIGAVFERTRLETLMLLAPPDLDPAWRQSLGKQGESESVHKMALGKILPGSKLRDLTKSCFIWGLDSI